MPDASHSRGASGRVALVTYARAPELTADDRLLVDALAARGTTAAAALWDDPHVDWGAHDAVVLRSCWDYHLRLDEFLGWVDGVERAGAPMFNPPSVVRWNARKTYLRALDAAGVPTVPTRWVDPGETTSLAAVLDETGWERAVVKPSVSASAYETWSTTREHAPADEPRFRALAARGPVLVQRFVREVIEAGEWSLIFFGGSGVDAFSHAVVKRPRDGDFRVQPEHGGGSTPAHPDARLVAEASAALRCAEEGAGPILYARVDGCVVDGRFVTMELELLEPSLFLGTRPGAADRLADALLARMRRG